LGISLGLTIGGSVGNYIKLDSELVQWTEKICNEFESIESVTNPLVRNF
jgi:hypothetical protein